MESRRVAKRRNSFSLVHPSLPSIQFIRGSSLVSSLFVSSMRSNKSSVFGDRYLNQRTSRKKKGGGGGGRRWLASTEKRRADARVIGLLVSPLRQEKPLNDDSSESCGLNSGEMATFVCNLRLLKKRETVAIFVTLGS